MIFNFISKSFGHAARLACGSVLALTLASCGGGGGSAGTEANSTGGASVASIQLTFSSPQIGATSTTPIT
ncbi:MAG TPA: hypothetical protein VK832_19820, partial [Burkholderiaceae bacterium]|nr:hypothetical protein [Burkholderiaceae bacterium]